MLIKQHSECLQNAYIVPGCDRMVILLYKISEKKIKLFVQNPIYGAHESIPFAPKINALLRHLARFNQDWNNISCVLFEGIRIIMQFWFKNPNLWCLGSYPICTRIWFFLRVCADKALSCVFRVFEIRDLWILPLHRIYTYGFQYLRHMSGYTNWQLLK